LSSLAAGVAGPDAAFWRLVLVVLVATAWPPDQPLPPAMRREEPAGARAGTGAPACPVCGGGDCAVLARPGLSGALCRELGVDADEFAALCATFTEDLWGT